jgi:hypothetical protein
VGVGPKELNNNRAKAPRVVWVPTRDRFGPPRGPGANPRRILTRNAGCEVHLWGADLASTEALLNSVLSAIHKVAHGSYEATEGEWKDQLGSVTNAGLAYVFGVTFAVPVTDAPSTEGPVTSIPTTGALRVGAPPTDSNG